MITANFLNRTIVDSHTESGFTLLTDYIINQDNKIMINTNDQPQSHHKDDTALKE